MATSSDKMRGLRFSRLPSLTTVLFLLGIVAFQITGFFGFSQALCFDCISLGLPLYAYFGFVLIVLQMRFSQNRSPTRLAYIFLASGVPLAFIGLFAFSSVPIPPIVSSPPLYYVLNLLLIIVFFYSAWDRRRKHLIDKVFTGGADAADTDKPNGPSRPFPIRSLARASDAAGLTLLFFVKFLLLFYFLGNSTFMGRFGLQAIQVGSLGLLDLAFMFVVAFFLLLSIANIVTQLSWRRFRDQFRRMLREAGTQVIFSLQFVLAPFLWLIAAFLLALFSYFTAGFLAYNREFQGCPSYGVGDLRVVWDLYSPWHLCYSQPSGDLLSYLIVIFLLILGGVTLFFVLFATAVVDYDSTLTPVIRRIPQLIGDISPRSAVFLLTFILALPIPNAIVVLVGLSVYEPFRVGPLWVVVLVASAIAFGVSRLFHRRRAPVK